MFCYVFYVSYGFEHRLLIEVGSGVITGLMPSDLVSQLRWTLSLLGVM
jgi:hypothetical protein